MMHFVPKESEEQAALIEWAERMTGKYPDLQWLYHIPNGGSRHPAEARNLKMQGVKPGVPDLHLPVPKGGYHGLYIEMKRRKGGQVSDGQKRWISVLQKLGHEVVVCYGWEQAKNEIEKYLKLR